MKEGDPETKSMLQSAFSMKSKHFTTLKAVFATGYTCSTFCFRSEVIVTLHSKIKSTQQSNSHMKKSGNGVNKKSQFYVIFFQRFAGSDLLI